MANTELFRFEWDVDKARINLKKHDISFEEAVSIFNDPNSITIYDENHSDTEDRFVDIGISSEKRILVVVYMERQNIIRIISCRKGTKKEKAAYEKFNCR